MIIRLITRYFLAPKQVQILIYFSLYLICVFSYKGLYLDENIAECMTHEDDSDSTDDKNEQKTPNNPILERTCKSTTPKTRPEWTEKFQKNPHETMGIIARNLQAIPGEVNPSTESTKVFPNKTAQIDCIRKYTAIAESKDSELTTTKTQLETKTKEYFEKTALLEAKTQEYQEKANQLKAKTEEYYDISRQLETKTKEYYDLNKELKSQPKSESNNRFSDEYGLDINPPKVDFFSSTKNSDPVSPINSTATTASAPRLEEIEEKDFNRLNSEAVEPKKSSNLICCGCLNTLASTAEGNVNQTPDIKSSASFTATATAKVV